MSVENNTLNEGKVPLKFDGLLNELQSVLTDVSIEDDENLDLLSARKAVLEFKSADTIKTILTLKADGKNYEEWKTKLLEIIELNVEIKMLMHFEKLPCDKIKGGIRMLLQKMINNEFRIKITDKSILETLDKLILPDQIKWLDGRYGKSDLQKVREKITEFPLESNKFKVAKDMKTTLKINQGLFNKRGEKYSQVIIPYALYSEIIELVNIFHLSC